MVRAMSEGELDLDWLEPTVVRSGPIELVREIELKEEGSVASFTATSEAEVPVSFSVTHEIPEGVPTKELGFHPEHEPMTWEIEDRVVTTEEVIDPDETIEVVFGLATPESTEIPEEVPDPVIEWVEPQRESVEPGSDAAEGAEEDGLIPSLRNSVLGDGGSKTASTDGPNAGNREPPDAPTNGVSPPNPDAPSPEAIDPDSAGSDSPSIQLAEPNGGSTDASNGAGAAGATSTSGDRNGSMPSPTTRSTPQSPGGPSATLSAVAEDIRSGDVAEDDLEVLREALGGSTDSTLDARLRHVQTRVDDFAAYITEMEAFIEDHGSASEVIQNLTDEMETLRDEVEAVREAVETAEDERSDLADRLDDVEDETTTVERDLTAEIESLHRDVERFTAMRETLLEALGPAEGSGAGTDT